MSGTKNVAPIVRGKGVPLALIVSTEEGEVQLGLRLLFNFNALALVEQRTGYSLLTGAIFKKLTVTTSLALFWASLQAYQPQYAGDEGYDAAGSLMTLKNNAEITVAVQEAFIQSLPDDQAAAIRKAIADTAAEAGAAPLAPTAATA